MPRQTKSQWDFGELFPIEPARRVLTVSELTSQVKRLLEKEVGRVWVTGEITNLRVQSSGHIYFTLKDANSQANCVLFRGEPVAGRNLIEDGRKVILEGDLTVYEPRGQYQLLVRSIELQGVGALQIAFEKLKQKLNEEGLFAAERKRSLPKFPQRIGLVTSPTGAAIRDVLHVIERRNPSLEIILVPCRVQGEGAAGEIASAIRFLNEWSAGPSTIESTRSRHLDLILVTRGGGSLEDLWAFNEETVARAIFESAIPVVSAVGHEIDFTISDFVADVRAATPSAAAEIITEGVFGSREFLAAAAGWMRDHVRRRFERDRDDFDTIVGRLQRLHPRRRLNDRLQLLDELQSNLQRTAKWRWRECATGWESARQRLSRLNPRQVVARRSELLGQLVRQVRDGLGIQIQSRRSQLTTALARIHLLSPTNVIDRGYSLTMDAATGKLIRHAGEVRSGQRLRTRVKRGEILSVAEAGKADSQQSIG